MGILRTLFGKKRPMTMDNLFAMPEASIDMEKAGVAYAGRAGVCFRAQDTKDFRNLLERIEAILKGAHAQFDTREDEYGYTWIILSGDISTAVTSIDLVYETLKDAGFDNGLLCAAFEFRKDDRPVYWIYNKRGKFYPFAPLGRERDVVLELKLKMQAPEEMPVETALSEWYPLWDLPLRPAGPS
jgi:hypothetical protein